MRYCARMKINPAVINNEAVVMVTTTKHNLIAQPT
jgi:hypothetical protein